MATVSGFLGYVNYREPFLGKALDYLLGAGCKGADGEQLEIVMPEAAAVAEMVAAAEKRLSGYAGEFFGRPLSVAVVTRPSKGPELKIFPIESSKAWNQIAFFLRLDDDCEDHAGSGIAALVIGKSGYRKLVGEFPAGGGPAELVKKYGGELFRAADLPAVIDRAVPRARDKRGIVHLVTLCRGRDDALALDYACARLKEYGTPGHEGPLEIRTLLGRLHLVFPGQFSTGLTLLHRWSAT